MAAIELGQLLADVAHEHRSAASMSLYMKDGQLRCVSSVSPMSPTRHNMSPEAAAVMNGLLALTPARLRDISPAWLKHCAGAG